MLRVYSTSPESLSASSRSSNCAPPRIPPNGFLISCAIPRKDSLAASCNNIRFSSRINRCRESASTISTMISLTRSPFSIGVTLQSTVIVWAFCRVSVRLRSVYGCPVLSVRVIISARAGGYGKISSGVCPIILRLLTDNKLSPALLMQVRLIFYSNNITAVERLSNICNAVLELMAMFRPLLHYFGAQQNNHTQQSRSRNYL